MNRNELIALATRVASEMTMPTGRLSRNDPDMDESAQPSVPAEWAHPQLAAIKAALTDLEGLLDAIDGTPPQIRRLMDGTEVRDNDSRWAVLTAAGLDHDAMEYLRLRNLKLRGRDEVWLRPASGRQAQELADALGQYITGSDD